MPGAMPPPINTAAAAKPLQFGAGAPGSAPQVNGYNSALQDLNKSLQLSGQTTSAQQMQLGQQLQQNQAGVAQNMASRGLGNTTVSQTMAQAPLNTYNMGMANVQNLDAQRQMSAYGNLAQMSAQGGQAISQMQQPYSQSQYANGIMNQQQAAANMQAGVAHQNSMGMQPFGQQQQQQQPMAQQQQAMQPQQPLYYQGPGASANLGGGANSMGTDQAALAAQYSFLMGDDSGE